MNNFYTLMTKLQEIEEGAKFSDIPASQRKEKHPDDWKVSMRDLDDEDKEGKISHRDTLAKNSGKDQHEGFGEDEVEECGDMPDDRMKPSLSSEVSMSMQDLLSLMAHLQKGEVGQHDEPLFGAEEEEVAEKFGNAMQGDSGTHIKPVSAVTATGNDMHSKGRESPKVNGGGNPMQSQLAELYASVKARKLDELSKDTLGSYEIKASKDAKDQFAAGHKKGRESGDIDGEIKDISKGLDRYKGVNKARDRMNGYAFTKGDNHGREYKAINESTKESNAVVRKLRK